VALTARNLGVWWWWYYGNQAPPGGLAVTNRMLSKLWTWGGVKAAHGETAATMFVAGNTWMWWKSGTGECGSQDLEVWQPGPGVVAAWVWREERSVAQKLKLVVTLMREAEEGFS